MKEEKSEISLHCSTEKRHKNKASKKSAYSIRPVVVKVGGCRIATALHLLPKEKKDLIPLYILKTLTFIRPFGETKTSEESVVLLPSCCHLSLSLSLSLSFSFPSFPTENPITTDTFQNKNICLGKLMKKKNQYIEMILIERKKSVKIID
jgi:hypothetical protein